MKDKKIFISDVEGPICKNDNALEISQHFIPHGEKLFSLLSKFDDYLADIKKEPNYKAGDTLRLILPFFKAFDINNSSIETFSASNLLLVPGAQGTIKGIKKLMPLYLISTSYRPYIKALCRALDFPQERAYCTELELDRYIMSKEEKKKIKRLRKKISRMPMIEFYPQCRRDEDIAPQHLKTIDALYEIFWGIVPQLHTSYSLLKEINPVGGEEKARALETIISRENASFFNAIYVGDSITDIEVLKMMKERGGLPISFNGNAYPFRFAEIAIISPNTQPLNHIAKGFLQGGKDVVCRMVEEIDFDSEEKAMFIITEENKASLIERSLQMRKAVRGEKIAILG